jgi:hypothetical protein
MPLPKFVVVHKDDSEDDVKFLARVELEAKGIVGRYTRPEHDSCIANLRNVGCLNRVFELAGVAYKPRSELGTEELTKASKKRKIEAAGKNLSKRVRALGKKKTETTKAAVPEGKTATPQGKATVSWGKGSLKRPSQTKLNPMLRQRQRTDSLLYQCLFSGSSQGN